MHVEESLSKIDLITAKTRKTLLRDWNDTYVPYDEPLKTHQVFENAAMQFPNKVATVFKEAEMSYTELLRKSKALGAKLQSMGCGQRSAITTLIERDLNTPIIYLGILFSGGFYVPISPEYPSERIAFMVSDSLAKVIITTRELAHHIPEDVKCPRILIDDIDYDECEKYTFDEEASEAGDVAYMTYTSGSTGKPKGVLVPHSGVVRLVRNTNFFPFDESTVCLQHSPVTFDATTFELYGPLLNGGKAILFHDKSTNIDAIESTILKHRCNFQWFTARLFDVLVDLDATCFHEDTILVCCGGEMLSLSHVNTFCERYPNIQMMNGYGPTEVTSFSTYYHFPKGIAGNRCPIGRPIANTTCYIIDKYNRPVPIGCGGELVLEALELHSSTLTDQKRRRNRSRPMYLETNHRPCTAPATWFGGLLMGTLTLWVESIAR